MSDCTVTLSPGDAIEPHLADGAVICLRPGVYTERLDLTHSVTLRGEAGAVLDGDTGGPTVRIGADRLEVVLEDLIVQNGAHGFGSGVLLEGYSKVEVIGCTVAGNTRGEGGGAGLGARRGWLAVRGTTFGPGDDVVITKTAEATFTSCAIQGDLAVLEKAKVRIEGGSVTGATTVRGTTTSTPVLTLAGATMGPIENHAGVPGSVIEE